MTVGAFPGWSTEGIDNRIVNPDVYANPPDILSVYRELRETDPVHWTEPRGFRPFWSITKQADIKAISKANDRFINSERTYLTPAENEKWTLETTGDTHLFRTLVDIDDPLHRKLRQITNEWFLPKNLKSMEDKIRGIARAHVDHMMGLGGRCDFVNEVSLFYPLRVIMEILGIPAEDEPRMLKMTQEMFGSGDPDVIARSEKLTSGPNGPASGGSGEDAVDLMALAQEYFEYFGKVIADRRANPKDDVSTVIAHAEVDGAPIDIRHALSYLVIIATAGHDTTSSSTAAGMHQLAVNPREFAKLKENPKLTAQMVEETIRWETPVKHFMRTCTEDTEVGGRTIRAGEHLTLFYWSGNRDTEAFDAPDEFRVDRAPNPQVAFGGGAHQCLGLHLARLEIRILFEELMPRLSFVELAGDPAWTRSNFVSGLKRLPIHSVWI
ncbi:MAG: cytochrome P450 [Pacificimonas sp.]